jgi:hypothetical protein
LLVVQQQGAALQRLVAPPARSPAIEFATAKRRCEPALFVIAPALLEIAAREHEEAAIEPGIGVVGLGCEHGVVAVPRIQAAAQLFE